MRMRVLLLCLVLVALTGLAVPRIHAATSCRVYVPTTDRYTICFRTCQCDDTGKAFACSIFVTCWHVEPPPQLTNGLSP